MILVRGEVPISSSNSSDGLVDMRIDGHNPVYDTILRDVCNRVN